LLSECLPLARRVHHSPYASGCVRRILPWDGERAVLPRLLLGVDAPAFCRRRNEPLVDRRADHFRVARKSGAARRTGRAAVGYFARGDGPAELGPQISLTRLVRPNSGNGQTLA